MILGSTKINIGQKLSRTPTTCDGTISTQPDGDNEEIVNTHTSTMSGNDDADGELSYIEPYDATLEQRPDSVVYQPIFAQLQSHRRRLVSLLRDTLVNSKYQNSMTRSLLEEVKRVKDDTSEQTMFAFSGDMAAGKSSVINSILSTGVIARKGASGGSCTWVVQRFMKPFDDQSSPFAAKVSFFNEQQIGSIIESMIEKYHRASVKDDQDEDACTEETRSLNYNDIRTVLDGFAAIFGDEPEFENEETAKAYLAKYDTDDDEGIVDDLKSKACHVAAQFLEGDQVVTIQKDTADELLFKLQPYTYQLGGEEGAEISPWPLVSVVDFGLDIPLLHQGIVLVDAPGLSDSNSTRASNASFYHRQCPFKITVADVSRAKDDKSLRESLAQGHWLRGATGTLLVLTRGDNIDGETEVTGSTIEKKKELQLKQEIKELREERRQLALRKNKLRREDQFDLEEEIRSKVAVMVAKTQEYDSCRILMRNKSVLQHVSQQYREMTNDPKPLSAFVIGNEAYKIHQAGYGPDEKPTLSVDDTGVPSLRHRIFEVPAEGKLKHELHLVNLQIPNLMCFFDLYCSATHLKRTSEIEAIILRPSGQIEQIVQGATQQLHDAIVKYILDPMEDEEASWVESARKRSNVWLTQHPKDNLSIFKNGGLKKGRKGAPDINFNRELSFISRDATASFFANLHKSLTAPYAEMGNAFAKQLAEVQSKIKENPQYKLLSDTTFSQSIQNERAQLRKSTMPKLIKEAVVQSNAVHHAMLSYFDEAMRPVYANITKIKGKGAPQKRIEKFGEEVSASGQVYTRVRDRVEKAFQDFFAAQAKQIEAELQEIVNTMHRKFKILCDSTIVKDEAEKKLEAELRAKLRVQVQEAKKVLDGDVRRYARLCKEYGGRKEGEPCIKTE